MNTTLRDQLRRSVAIERARDGLIDALTPKPVVFDMDRLRAKAAFATARTLKAGAREFLNQPEKLFALAPTLDACNERIRLMIANRGHWTFDLNRLIALRQARLAHRALRRFPTVWSA